MICKDFLEPLCINIDSLKGYNPNTVYRELIDRLGLGSVKSNNGCVLSGKAGKQLLSPVAGCLSNFNLIPKAWRIPRELLVLSLYCEA